VVREALTPEMIEALEPREVAALFIARRLEGLTDSEQTLLAKWLAQHETHQGLLDSAERAWAAFAEPEGDEILAAMRAHALEVRPRGWAAWRPAVAAAAVLLVAGGAALFVLSPWSPGPDQQLKDPSTPIQYASVRGEVKVVELPDGSRMTLDADSTAVGRFGERGRSIELTHGRAYFEVASDPTRPFAVAADGKSVVVVGTRFDVNLTPDGMTVTLAEGRVEVGSRDTSRPRIALEPGQQYAERNGAGTVRTIGPATENVLAWRRGLVNFDDESLAVAAAIMNRYSDERIVINDPAVAGLRLSGQFKAGDIRRFATTLADLHRLEIREQPGEIELVQKK
jgi:transmembrane sensor